MMECLEIVFGGTMAASAVAGAIAAWRGVSAWRDQLLGKNHFQLSIRLLTLSSELQDIIKRIRLPFEDETPLWNEFGRVGTKLNSAYTEAWAHWGDDFLEHKKAILVCINKLRKARKQKDDDNRIGVQKNDDRVNKYSLILYLNNDDDSDDFSKEIQKYIDDLVVATKKYLHQKRPKHQSTTPTPS